MQVKGWSLLTLWANQQNEEALMSKKHLDSYRQNWELFKVLLAINLLLLKLLLVGGALLRLKA